LELGGADRERLQMTLEVGEPEEHRLDPLGLALGDDGAACFLARRRSVLGLHERHPFSSFKTQKAPDAEKPATEATSPTDRRSIADYPVGVMDLNAAEYAAYADAFR